MIPHGEDDKPQSHTGKCVLDLSTDGFWLVCVKDTSHMMNLKKRVNRATALRALYDSGSLRPGGHAEREVLGSHEESSLKRPRVPAFALEIEKEDSDG